MLLRQGEQTLTRCYVTGKRRLTREQWFEKQAEGLSEDERRVLASYVTRNDQIRYWLGMLCRAYELSQKADFKPLEGIPDLSLNDDLRPEQATRRVAASSYQEFDRDFIVPLELLRAYDKLTYRQRFVVIWRYAFGRSLEEIAEALQYNDIRTLRQFEAAGMSILRRALGETPAEQVQLATLTKRVYQVWQPSSALGYTKRSPNQVTRW